MESRQNVIGILGNMGFTNVAGVSGSMSIQTRGKVFAVTSSSPETQEETLTCDEFISQYGNVNPLQSDLTYSGINASLDSENAELRNSVRNTRVDCVLHGVGFGLCISFILIWMDFV